MNFNVVLVHPPIGSLNFRHFLVAIQLIFGHLQVPQVDPDIVKYPGTEEQGITWRIFFLKFQ